MSSFRELIEQTEVNQCPRPFTLALKDTMNVVSGKWKLPIIAALFYQKNRFKDLLGSLDNAQDVIKRAKRTGDQWYDRTYGNQSPPCFSGVQTNRIRQNYYYCY